MQTKFKVNYKNRELGPLTEAQIMKMIENKQLALTDKYHDDEKKEWIALSERFGPQEKAAAPAPAPEPVVTPEAAKPTPPPVQQMKPAAPKPTAPPKKVEAEVKTAPTTPQFEVMDMADDTVPLEIPPQEGLAAIAGKIVLSGGVGTLNFKQVKAGQVSLKLKSGSGLDLPKELSLTIQSGPASQIQMQAPHECKAGEEISVELKTMDTFDNFVADFHGTFEVNLVGPQSESCAASFENGKATVKFKPTLAENFTLQVKDTSEDRLALPLPLELKVHPNEPVKLIAEAPHSVRAGEDIALKVTALDAYGNVVTDFKGEIELEVEATPVGKAS